MAGLTLAGKWFVPDNLFRNPADRLRTVTFRTSNFRMCSFQFKGAVRVVCEQERAPRRHLMAGGAPRAPSGRKLACVSICMTALALRIEPPVLRLCALPFGSGSVTLLALGFKMFSFELESCRGVIKSDLRPRLRRVACFASAGAHELPELSRMRIPMARFACARSKSERRF